MTLTQPLGNLGSVALVNSKPSLKEIVIGTTSLEILYTGIQYTYQLREICFIVYASGITEKLHSRFMKYILGVNRKASTIAFMSELERYPIYFSVILSMLKYFHRLNNLSEGLLYDAFVCNKELNSCQTNT